MVATSGAQLLPHDAVKELRAGLLPLTTVLTPNIPEATLFLQDAGVPAPEIRGVEDLEAIARAVQALGPEWVLVKGGHAPLKADLTVARAPEEKEVVVDVLYGHGRLYRIQGPYQDSKNTHGTGCSLACRFAGWWLFWGSGMRANYWGSRDRVKYGEGYGRTAGHDGGVSVY
jgi:hydroxymethylpyrimidine kinase/phosphomethylpyrimidine kinase